ncbi:MAG TPA: nitroreductase family deazaflavin-dependent oxidoreductase, partial [Chloroflexota bacterium]|nr:nitroreductase family deazaflavin-dependent oxidoreductase [Chloroflexota bacterium]
MAGPSDWNKKIIAQFRANGGKNVAMFGDRLLLLTTKGAKSGRERVNPLAYTRDRDRIVIVASKAGAPTNPDWFHNLVANPVTTIELGSDKLTVRATEAKGAERDRLYAAHAAVLPQFKDYETKTSRKIPVVVLEPLAG